MKAVILAAGKGTRMGKLTDTLPKPMVRVKDKPVLQWIIEGLRDHADVTDVFLIIGWQGDVIRNYFGDGTAFGVRITYGEQKTQDGTGKAPEIAREWVGTNSFILSYGDILIDPADYAVFRQAPDADGVISTFTGGDLTKLGAVVLDERGYMRELIEKSPNPPPNAYANVGIYLLPPRIFDFTARLEKSPRGEYELTDALLAFVKSGGALKGAMIHKRWVDVRDPEILTALNTDTSS
jgi:NDP-sugar pyrophosphorylase family protein